MGSSFEPNLNQVANDNLIIGKHSNVQGNAITKINKNYWRTTDFIDLNKTNQLDSVAASFKIFKNNRKDVGIALKIIPQKHQLMMLQVHNED